MCMHVCVGGGGVLKDKIPTTIWLFSSLFINIPFIKIIFRTIANNGTHL